MIRPLLAVLLAAAVAAGPASAGAEEVAALQVGLRAAGLYTGTVDGRLGSATARAVRAFQARAGLVRDGIPGPATRAALQRRGKWRWEVAKLQFALARSGFPSGRLDGVLGPRTRAALRRFQRSAGLRVDGVAGPATRASLRRPPPSCSIALRRPVDGARGDGFGPRGDRFHAGLDFLAAAGEPVAAAAAGTVTYAGPRSGGWGVLVAVAHSSGVRTLYAHLSVAGVRAGERVGAGERIGAVGATGSATGPHLHFEVRVRGAAVDPAPALSH